MIVEIRYESSDRSGLGRYAIVRKRGFIRHRGSWIVGLGSRRDRKPWRAITKPTLKAAQTTAKAWVRQS